MKNNLNIYVCDDNRIFADKISEKLNLTLTANRRHSGIAVFLNAADLITRFKQTPADVVFLDIDMPSMSGFEAAEKLQAINENVYIIFVTSHEEMVFQSYEFHPFWFVRKNHLSKDLEIALSSLLTKIDAKYVEEQQTFNLVTDNKTTEIDINMVVYIQSYKHYLIIKSFDGNDIQVRGKISEVEKQLLPLNFIRVQNGVIVNCRFITKLTSKTVDLRSCDSHSKNEFNISRDRTDFVKNEFQKFTRSR